jgi:hypothetical protein
MYIMKSDTYTNGLPGDLQDNVAGSENVARTCEPSDTGLARTCSQDVQRDLAAMRTRHGADSPIGHRCSNLLGQIRNLRKEPDKDARARLRENIEKSLADIQRLMKEVAQ